MTNPQGTRWESEIVNRAADRLVDGWRLVKTGKKDEADVYLVGAKDRPPVPVVLWKRVVKGDKKTRQPRGERYVAILTVDDFLDLLADSGREAYVQAKWTERLSVTKVLSGLRAWLNSNS